MRALDFIRRANEPRDPEHSIALRVAASAAVVVAMAACAALGEVAWVTALGAIAFALAGMAFSYRTRIRPPGYVKVVVAIAALAAFTRFFYVVITPAAGFVTIEDPLTQLLISVLVVHSFHVPSRRDLLFSFGASAGLMAVGGAQAIDLTFGFYVVAWAAAAVWGLTEMWRSASGGGRVSPVGLGSALAALVAAAAAMFLVLPAPTVAAKVGFISKAGLGGPISVPGALAGDGGSPATLSQAGSPSGRSGVGGYLGFANSLDTALRGTLSHTLVMQVRAQRPSYWVGETFNTWDGGNWTSTATPSRPLNEESPFFLPVPEGDDPLGQPDLQTFYIAGSTADLVFHADSASELWFPASKVYAATDGTIVSPIGLGRGSIYSVESQVVSPTADQLRSATGPVNLPPALARSSVQLPHAYPRVQALAQAITAGDTNTYDQVEALIAWIGAHTRYSTDIPPLPAGADTVDEFLFGNRVGFCEQISTSLAVMLRTLGIPAREAVGYVPGAYDPITDLYQIRADDAHAWVQVWFPGYGWQSFDPTAVVPAANPSPGSTALRDLAAALSRIPPVPVGGTVLVAALGLVAWRWRRARPATWTERLARVAERAGRRAGRPRRLSESLAEYATRLDSLAPGNSTPWYHLATAAEASIYGGHQLSIAEQRHLVTAARRLRVRRSHS